MRSVLLFLVCAVLCSQSMAQFPGGGAPGGARPGGGGGVPSIGHFYGRIVDGKTNKGVEAASIQLIQSKLQNLTNTTFRVWVAC